MAGYIPNEFIDTLLEQTDIVELISSYLPLKKKGASYMACCPFHGEKTPSFSVNPKDQFYHCFGCGSSGNAINFIREYEHLEFIDAVELLAERIHLPIPRVISKTFESQSSKNDLYALMDYARHAYYQNLQVQLSNQQGEMIDYLEQRQLQAAIIQDYAIGFAPDSWDFILKLLQQQCHQPQLLEETGLIIRNDRQRVYDRFRKRLMFPIRDKRGRTIGFGGRIIDNDDTQAKYINSPETPLFHKSRELYGFYEMNQSLRQIQRILVVEGYMDVVSLAQQGIRYAVATLGTATTTDHIQLLFRSSNEIIFCFDGDNAGKKAAWKALETVLPLYQPNWKPRFMFLQEGEDPDSYIRRYGKKQFEQQLEQAQTLPDFFFSYQVQQIDMNKSDGNTQLIDRVKHYLERIPAGNSLRLTLSQQLARITGINPSEIHGHLQTHSTGNTRLAVNRSAHQQISTNSAKPFNSNAWKAVHYLLHYPELAEIAGDGDNYLGIPVQGMDIFIRMLDLFQFNPKLSTARLLALWNDSSQELLLRELMLKPLLIRDFEAIRLEFIGLLRLFMQQKQKLRLGNLQIIENSKGLTATEKLEYLQLVADKS